MLSDRDGHVPVVSVANISAGFQEKLGDNSVSRVGRSRAARIILIWPISLLFSSLSLPFLLERARLLLLSGRKEVVNGNNYHARRCAASRNCHLRATINARSVQ